MLNFNIITLFPHLFDSFTRAGVIGKAFDKKLASVNIVNPRDFAKDKHKTVDSMPFGGGDGMLMKVGPLAGALNSITQPGLVVNLSPQGSPWTSEAAKEWSHKCSDITIICGRYAGIDQRFINKYVDKEISLGDYVISGGELGAQILMDSMMRFLPDVLGDSTSAENDTFKNHLLEAPQFTKNRVELGQDVPEVLLSGHHKNIEDWKDKVSLVKTYFKRTDLFKKSKSSEQQLNAAVKYLKSNSVEELLAIGFSQNEISRLQQSDNFELN